MIPNPLAGMPTPWSNQPRTEAGTLAAFASQGLSPQIPTAAQEYNEWLQRVGEWANWVEAGTNAADADAHIVETNGAGLISAQAAELTQGAFGPGSTQLPLPHGAVVPDTKTLTMEDGSDIALQGDASIEGPDTTHVTTGWLSLIDVGGWAELGEVRFFEDTNPSFGAGVMQWDGRAWTGGNAVAAPRLAQPITSAAAGPTNTINAIIDSGASVTLQMRNGETAKIDVRIGLRSDTVGNTINFRIEANAVIIGPNDTIYEPSGAGVSLTYVSTTQLYVAGADGPVVFKARFGAAAGTATMKAASLTATHA
jgi:hypothetical protein